MVARALLIALLAVAAAQVGSSPAAGHAELRAPLHYLGRADARLCPSPMCGGLWLRPVNGARPLCAKPGGRECYVTGLDFGDLPLDAERRQQLTQLVASGGALVTGSPTSAGYEGFPELRALRVTGLQRPASARKPGGPFRLLADNGVRCVTQPCFSIQAVALNTGRAANVSELDLSGTDASPAERRWAHTLVATRQLVVSGVVVRKPNGGRVVVASQIYFAVRLG